jgi:peptidyl-prolyl cis-trans isomerase A (cyclophilin A)
MKPNKRARRITAAVSLLVIWLPAWGTEVSVCTDVGPFTIELLDEKAPQHVANFLTYVENGFYSGTAFHRVVAGFVVQGGGYDRELRKRETHAAVSNESRNGVSNARGTVAAARTGEPHSATSQFYVNLVDNTRLDGTDSDWGYSVFGRVTSGMDVLDAIAGLPTSGVAPFSADVPTPLVAITSMAVLDRAALETIPPETRTATIKQEIMSADAVGDAAGVLEWVRLYRASCAPTDPDVLIVEADTALSSNQAERARYVLDDYFRAIDASHPRYARAMSVAETLALVAPPAPDPAAVFARCEVPEQPPLPDGAVDSHAIMEERREAVHAFMVASDIYLDCLTEVGDEHELTDEQDAVAAAAHNQMVTQVDDLVESFNEQVRIFKAREQ